MTDLPSDSKATLVARARNHFRSLIKGADVSRTSDYGMLSAMLGALAHGAQQQAHLALRNTLATQSGGGFLAEHAQTYGADTPGVKASGYVVMRGTGLASPTTGDVLVHADGRRYVVTAPSAFIDATYSSFRLGEWSTKHFLRCAGAGSNHGARPGAIYSYVDLDGVTRYLGSWDVAGENTDSNSLVPLYMYCYPAPLLQDLPPVGTLFSGEYGRLVPVEAEEPGEAYNVQGPDTLALEAGADPDITHIEVTWIEGGRDAARPEDQRRALVTRFGERGTAGDFQSIIRLVEEQDRRPGRAVVCQTPNFPGRYSVLLGGDPDALPFQGDGAAAVAKAQLDALGPAGSSVTTALPARPRSSEGGIRLWVRVRREHAPPWRPTQLLADAAGHTQTRVQLTSSPVGVASVGDPLVVVTGGSGITDPASRFRSVCQRRVVGVGANYLDLDAPLESDIVRNVFPGSSIVPAVIERLRTLFWGMAPLAYYGGESRAVYGLDGRDIRFPSPGVIAAELGKIDGVLEMYVSSPSSIHSHAFLVSLDIEGIEIFSDEDFG